MSEQKERTPRNTPGGAIFVGCVLVITLAGILWLSWPPREVQVVRVGPICPPKLPILTPSPTPTPTPTPAPEFESSLLGLEIEPYDLTDLLDLEWDATVLDIETITCEKLFEVTIWGLDDIGVTWRDGLDGCEMIEGLDILVGDVVFQPWRCSLPGGIQIDWRNTKRNDCNQQVGTLSVH